MFHNQSELRNCVKLYVKNELSSGQAAAICGYSAQRIRDLSKKYAIYGDAAFINGHRGQKPHNKTSDTVKKKLITAYRAEFIGYNFRLFYDTYCEDHPDFNLSYQTVYTILTEAGFTSPEKRKIPKTDKSHRPRLRRRCEGELLQIDATPYDWFGDGHNYSLHGSIDDATGKLTALYMCENECLYGYLELIRRTFYEYGGGHPVAVYSDRAAIFCVTPREKQKLTIQEQLKGLKAKKTQWQRVLDEVNVEQILAWSPQAKGRIERVWRTLQGRLPLLFKRAKIKTIEGANIWLLSYIEKFNAQYGIEAASPIKLWHKTNKDPDYILSARFDRRTNSIGVFSFQGYKFKLCKKRSACIDFELCISERGIQGYVDGQWYPVQLLEDLQEVEGENCPQVLKNIIHKYMYADGKLKCC